MERRFRSRYGRAAVVRAALVVFVLSGALIAAIVFTLDLNARRSNDQQAETELASTARVAASTFATMRANLRAHVGELAASAELQQAVVTRKAQRVRSFARLHNARIIVRGHAVGRLAGAPRMSATATMTSRGRVVARVTVGVRMDRALLDVLERSTPMPEHAALMLVQHGRVIAGGPIGARADAQRDRVAFGSVSFKTHAQALGVADASVVALEPVSAVAARVNAYRRRLLFAAAITLALAAGLATRLSRPVARILGDLARLTRQAQTDGMTNLANRRALDERLDDEVDHARRLGTNVAFVIADIDDFKSVNDRFGHQAGDDVLRAVSKIFTDAVRELDLPGRYGGEEIAVVLPGTNLTGARNLAERIRKCVEELCLTTPAGEVRVTASFGAACFPTHGTVEELIAAADAALYEAKRSGKNRVVTATSRKKSRRSAVGDAAPAETAPEPAALS